MFIQNVGINGGGNIIQNALVIHRGIKLQEKMQIRVTSYSYLEERENNYWGELLTEILCYSCKDITRDIILIGNVPKKSGEGGV